MEHGLILEVLYKCIEFKDIAIYWKHATTLSHKWMTPDFLTKFVCGSCRQKMISLKKNPIFTGDTPEYAS